MSGYIQDMRKLVGHRTLIQCAASAIVIREDGALLMGRRTDNGLWGYFGGSSEIDEPAEECAKRELKEEAGLTADELELFCVNSGPQTHYIYPNGDEVSNFEAVFLCKNWHGTPFPQPEEITELRWFFPCELSPDMISPPIRPVVEKYLKSVLQAV